MMRVCRDAQGDGSIIETEFASWVKTTREKATAADRIAVADLTIGNVFTHSPAENLKRYAAKVFDLELTFKPRPEEVVSIALPKVEWANAALPTFQRVNACAIRYPPRSAFVPTSTFVHALHSEVTRSCVHR